MATLIWRKKRHRMPGLPPARLTRRLQKAEPGAKSHLQLAKGTKKRPKTFPQRKSSPPGQRQKPQPGVLQLLKHRSRSRQGRQEPRGRPGCKVLFRDFQGPGLSPGHKHFPEVLPFFFAVACPRQGDWDILRLLRTFRQGLSWGLFSTAGPGGAEARRLFSAQFAFVLWQPQRSEKFALR